MRTRMGSTRSLLSYSQIPKGPKEENIKEKPWGLLQYRYNIDAYGNSIGNYSRRYDELSPKPQTP